jgi:hypothetical protein
MTTIKTTIKKEIPLSKRIAKSAFDALNGRVSGITREYNYCLQFARRVVEVAMGLKNRGFYDLVVGEDSNPAAKELESLLRKQRPAWVASSAQEGDLVWWNNLPPNWGHVGVVVTYNKELWVAQNTTVERRGIDFGGAFQLVKFSDHATPTTIIRIGG